MHQPRPYGLHTIGLPLTSNDESFIAAVTQRITNLKEVSGVGDIRMVYDLPDGGYVIVQDMGGSFRAISHKPLPKKEVVFDGLAKQHIPMLYSGLITKPMVFENEPVGLRLTEQARTRLTQYDNSIKKPNKDIELQRFRIDYANKFSEFKPRFETKILRTQYTALRPTWYSGAMSEIVQIVGAYGRQDVDELPDEELERARMILPAEVSRAIELEMGSVRLPGYTGLPNLRGQIQYDYKFNNTNAVGFDSDNKPWLLRINSSGVWAMPLPIIPATATEAFRRYIDDVNDEEIIAILNRFGGMPSGESFPERIEDFESWRRAGAVIKVCNASDFYQHISYSSACGWSLNARGSEGYNTCYDYYDDEGLGYGLTYKLRLDLLPAKEHLGEKDNDISSMLPEQTETLQNYLNSLIPALSIGTAETAAIFYKLRRVGPFSIYNRALTNNGDMDIDYWKNLELEPIAKHAGNISEVYRGYLYHPARFESQPQIKFPEPLIGGCMSHNFLPLINGRYSKNPPNSDTIMFAYYIGNDLKVIKYFVDWGSFQRSIETNFEAYMRVGSWKQIEYSGATGLQGYFYSTDIDDRKIVSPTTKTTTIEGEDKGYDSQPYFAFDRPFHMCGTLWRKRYYTHKTNTETISDESVLLAVCIPYFCRNAVLHAKRTSGYSQKGESYQLHNVQDPYTYRYWTYHNVFAWMQMTIKNPKGVPYPRNGNPVWVEEKSYIPTPENNFADSGDWIPALPDDYTWLIHPDSNVWNMGGGGGPPTIDNYSINESKSLERKGTVSISIDSQPFLANKNIPDNRYYISSPDEFGGIFYRDAVRIAFGNNEYFNTSEQGIASSRAYRGYTRLADHQSAHIFIGVINE